MSIKTAMGTTIFAAALMTGQAWSLGSEKMSPAQTPQSFATEFGNALPPIGYVRFCAENPAECKPRDSDLQRLAMDPERWSTLYQVNTYVNGKIAPVSDQDLYGEVERWTYPVDAGDCEDYLLLKKRYLEGLGFPPEALLITVVLDEKNEGHAVLTVTTEGGDFILDNRRNDVLRWSDVNYTFLKRQSHSNPAQWMALVKQPTSNSGFVSGNNSR